MQVTAGREDLWIKKGKPCLRIIGEIIDETLPSENYSRSESVGNIVDETSLAREKVGTHPWLSVILWITILIKGLYRLPRGMSCYRMRFHKNNTTQGTHFQIAYIKMWIKNLIKQKIGVLYLQPSPCNRSEIINLYWLSWRVGFQKFRTNVLCIK